MTDALFLFVWFGGIALAIVLAISAIAYLVEESDHE